MHSLDKFTAASGTSLPSHITSDEQGNVAWRGTVVENLSSSHPNNLTAELADISRRCQLLEDKGFPVTPHTVVYSHCYDAEPGTPWKRALCHLHAVYQRSDGTGAAFFERPHSEQDTPRYILAYVKKGSVVIKAYWNQYDVSEAMSEHGFRFCGYGIARDDMMKLLETTGLTVQDVDNLLDLPH